MLWFFYWACSFLFAFAFSFAFAFVFIAVCGTVRDCDFLIARVLVFVFAFVCDCVSARLSAFAFASEIFLLPLLQLVLVFILIMIFLLLKEPSNLSPSPLSRLTQSQKKTRSVLRRRRTDACEKSVEPIQSGLKSNKSNLEAFIKWLWEKLPWTDCNIKTIFSRCQKVTRFCRFAAHRKPQKDPAQRRI